MRGSPLFTYGIILAILGAIALSWGGFTYWHHETIVDVGPVKVSADRQKEIPISPVLGGVALAGGVAMIIVGSRKV